MPFDRSGPPQSQAAADAYDYDRGENREASLKTADKASTFVPLDSWIYPAFDRLAAMGYMPTSSSILRPWTRLESARLLAVAHVHIDTLDDVNAPLLAALDREFGPETSIIDGGRNTAAQLDTTYERFTGIAGTPLRDGFHFAQTLVDDFGRPYGKGPNSITGLSGSAEAGPLAFYIDAEYQYASAIPLYNPAARQVLATGDIEPDNLPFGWNLIFGTTSHVKPIEAYASLTLRNWTLSAGQQALWWGPDRGTSLILSNNAAPMPMLRLSRAKPVAMPSILSWLGPLHFELFLARQGGIHYVGLGPTFTLYGSASQPLTPPPYIWGVAATFKPTRNFEFGVAHTTIFAGYGRPLTFGTFLHTFSTVGNGQDVDPGKRVTEVNFSYHLPIQAQNVVIYTEAMAWDDPLQGKFVARYAMDPGVYLPSLPKLKHLDLRLEGAYTDLPKLTEPDFFYYNAHYPQGYTNDGQILGSWVGRQGIGGQASSTYWFSPRKKATLTYRKMVADSDFFRGGTTGDLAGDVSWTLRSNLELTGKVQYERWGFPLLGSGTTSNVAATFGIRFYPKAGAIMR